VRGFGYRNTLSPRKNITKCDKLLTKTIKKAQNAKPPNWGVRFFIGVYKKIGGLTPHWGYRKIPDARCEKDIRARNGMAKAAF